MALAVSDASLGIGLAILGWCGALIVHKQLELVRAISESTDDPPPPSANKVNQQTQDAIKLSTLSDLSQSTNPEIRDAVTRIVAERALTSPTTWRLLRQKLSSKTDVEARNQALQILVQFGPASDYDVCILRETPRQVEYEEFFRLETFKACIKCLCNMLPAARQAEHLRHHHDSAEADAMWVMCRLTDSKLGKALEAGLVRKWLVNYPFNMRYPEKSTKEVIVETARGDQYSDDYERLLGCVLYNVVIEEKATVEMAEYGINDPDWVPDVPFNRRGLGWGVRHLYGPSPSEMTFGGGSGSDGVNHFQRYPYSARETELEPMEMVPTSLQDFPSNMLSDHPRLNPPRLMGGESSSPRRREESDEERALRSRRREAMVFAEGGGPIRREDIIESPFQRDDQILDEEVEEELEQLIEEIGEQPARGSNQGGSESRARTWLAYLTALRPDGSIRR